MFNKLFSRKNNNNVEPAKTNNAEPAKEELTEELLQINIIEAEDANPVTGRHKRHRNSVQSEEFRQAVWDLIKMKYKNREIAKYLGVLSGDVAIAKNFLKKHNADFTPFVRLNKKQKELKSKVDVALGFNLGNIVVETNATQTQSQEPSLVGFLAMYNNGTTVFMTAENIKAFI